MEILQRLIKVKDLILYTICWLIGIFIMNLFIKNYERALVEALTIIGFAILCIVLISRKVWVNK